MASSILCLLIFPVLALAMLSASALDFVSIDCGSSVSYTDGNSIDWVGDDGFVENGLNGKSYKVQNPLTSSQAMNTLRVFTTRKKNCYSIEAVKGDQYLVRPSFYYGNYDKKSSPPTFDVLLDGTILDSVETSAEKASYIEVIYVAAGDYISVCVAQTKPNQFPFISAIEVRALDPSMYSQFDSNYRMVNIGRIAYGATKTIRYPDDAYDRIWDPSKDVTGILKVTNEATAILNFVEDKPPTLALQTAVTSSKTSDRLVLVSRLPSVEVPIYITMFFSEVTLLDSSDTRSFRIYVDDEDPSDPVVPVYGGVTEMYIVNRTGSSNISISLEATSDSSLPPLINAMEAYYLEGPLTEGTHSDDVEGLAALQEKFKILQAWTDDPCLPFPYTWDWVNCTTDDIPRVTALYLSGYGLSGQLPDFSSMDALVTIDMHNNSLTGAIPSFLGTLPNLEELNLAKNKFSGPVPSTISKNKQLKLDDSGNSDLCATGESCKTIQSDETPSSGSSGSEKKTSKLPLILGIAIPIFVVFWAVVVVCVCVTSSNKRKRAAMIGAIGTGVQMNGEMAGKFDQAAAMNQQYDVNIQEQTTADYQPATADYQPETGDYQPAATPEHVQDQDDRALRY